MVTWGAPVLRTTQFGRFDTVDKCNLYRKKVSILGWLLSGKLTSLCKMTSFNG